MTIHHNFIQVGDVLKIKAGMNIPVDGVMIRSSGVQTKESAMTGEIEEMKKDQRLGKIPVIIVTSVESPQDKARGLALGAEAYIIKRKFDNRSLLETIRQIL